MDKSKLRKVCVAAREALEPESRVSAAARVAEIPIPLDSLDRSRPLIVSGYFALGAELDPSHLLAKAAHADARTCLPVITPKGQPLLFRRWSPGDPLFDRMWGIREPAPTAAMVEPDLLLIPLLAFDADGWRLGYGGGYYDRTLARLRALKPIVAVGLAFDEQQLPHVPHGPFDQRLDWILTPSGARKFPFVD